MSIRRAIAAGSGSLLLMGLTVTLGRQSGLSEEAGRVTALETAWNHALVAKDTKALDMLMAGTMVALDSDGKFLTKDEYLAGIKAPDFQPTQAVTEQSHVQIYGDTAVVTGIFRLKGVEKGKPYLLRERTVDTWVKMDGTWKCVADVAVLVPSKQAAE